MNLDTNQLFSSQSGINKAPVSYNMNFSDDGQNDHDSERKNHSNQHQPKGKGYVSLIILALAFIAAVVMMLYFFVFRNTNPTSTFSSSDAIYSVDVDRDGTIDQDADSHPDFSNWNHGDGTFSVYESTENTTGIISKSGLGDLANILINTDTYSPTLTVAISNVNSNVVYLSGTYNVSTTLPNNKASKTTYSYSATVSFDIYRYYVQPIINFAEVKTNGVYSGYYNSKTYAYGAQSTSSVSSWLIPLIFGIAIIGFVIYFINKMYKSMGAGSSGSPMSGFVNNVARKETGSKVRFADVAGCDEAKAELVEMVDYFHSTDKYTRLGAKLPHGVLLVGPPDRKSVV